MRKEFKVPELGESVAGATVAKVLISKGDVIRPEQSVVELETDKAVMEVPSDIAGTVAELLVKEGDVVKVGQSLFTLDSADDDTRDSAPMSPAVTPEADAGAAPENVAPDVAQPSPAQKASPAARRPKKSPAPQAAASAPETEPPSEIAPAAPSVRRFAREIGIEIATVTGSGPSGRISIEDVKAHARAQAAGSRPAAPSDAGMALPDFTRWGPVEREPMSRVRRLTAERMSRAWSLIPHVTQFGKADVTDMERLRHQYQGDAEKAGGRLTLMVILIKALAGALKTFPKFNAGVDAERHELVFRKYYHIGVAMDTDRGLLVPVIRDVDRKNVIELSVELARITAKARDGKMSVDDLQGGCFTLSNSGALGGDVFTPIVNWPEAAIIGMARARTEAIYRDGALAPRTILPLALSYDHRVIDGADGVRFMQWIVAALEEPVKLLWEG